MAATQERSTLEKHLQSAIMAVVLATVMWIGNTVVQVDKRTAVIEEAVAQLRHTAQTAYPSAAAQRDQQDVARRLDRIEARLDRMEQAREASR